MIQKDSEARLRKSRKRGSERSQLSKTRPSPPFQFGTTVFPFRSLYEQEKNFIFPFPSFLFLLGTGGKAFSRLRAKTEKFLGGIERREREREREGERETGDRETVLLRVF